MDTNKSNGRNAIHWILIISIFLVLFLLIRNNSNSDEWDREKADALSAKTFTEEREKRLKKERDDVEAKNWREIRSAVSEELTKIALENKENGWERVEVKMEGDQIKSIAASLWYRQDKSITHLTQVSNDTKGLVRAALKVMQGKGVKPADEWVSMSIHAYRPAVGETGKNLVTVFGKSSYNFNNDSIEFTPAENLPSRVFAH